MANIFEMDRWILDTAQATLFVARGTPVYVKRIRWVGTGLTSGTSAVVIQDADSKVIWESVATGATVVESDLIERFLYDGFSVPTLSGGRVYIELK